MSAQLRSIPVELLCRGEFQPRQTFAAEPLQELANSIKSQGLIEPLVVRPIKDKHYEIIAGERRWRAAQLAGLSEVPCIIKPYNDEQAAAVSLIENIQRENLNPIEEAMGYQRMIDEFFFHHDEVAQLVGKSRTTITNSLRLLTLDKRVQACVIDQVISMGHAKAIAALPPTQQFEFTQQVIKQRWSVRQTEQAISKPVTNSMNARKDRDVARLEQLITEQTNTPVEIDADGQGSGWLKFKFYDNDTLAGILERLKLEY